MVIFFVLLFGFILRLVSINQSLWLDEATSILIARDFSIKEILERFSPDDFHPPFYYIVLKFWISAFGFSEIAVRSLSVLFGTMTIWVVYKIAQILTINHKSLIIPRFSALLLATAPLHIYYSQEARMYVLETLLATIVAYFVLKIVTSKKADILQFIWLSISSATLLYTDYLPSFLLMSFFIFLIIYHRRFLPYTVGWVVITAVIFIPWIPTFLTQINSGLMVRQSAPLWWTTLGKTNLKELMLVPVKFMIGRISSYDKVFYAVSVAVASLSFVVSFIQSFAKFSKTKFLWFWFLGPLALTALFGIFFSGFSYFRLIFVLPAFYIIVAFGSLSLSNTLFRKTVITGLLCVNLVSSGIYLLNPRFHREDWRGAVSWVEEHSRNIRALSVFVTANQRDAYQYYAKSIPSTGPSYLLLEIIEEKPPTTIWLFRYVQPIFDQQDQVRRKIEEEGYKKIDERDFNGVVVWEYDRQIKN